MNIIDIVNKEVNTITTCESEPIHIPGSIQPHGVLLATDHITKRIEYCSANSSDVLHLRPEKFLNLFLKDVWSEAWAAVQEYEGLNDLHVRTYKIFYKDIAYNVSIHKSNTLFLLEVEHLAEIKEKSFQSNQIQEFASLIEQCSTLSDLCQRVAEQMRSLLGYDRVMIYRFDKDYNGEVIAESKCAELTPFLGLHYPHTDIPVQARDLYLKNLVRVIADVHYKPVPLLTIDDGGPKSVDLSKSVLRSVSPIHIEYLINMGVGATLTVSLLQNGRLWGLISCHHRKPKVISPAEREAALFQGHFLSSQIKVQEVSEEYHLSITLEAHFEQLVSKLTAEEDFSQKFEQFTSLLSLVNASGVLIVHNGIFHEKGIVPPRGETIKLLGWIEQNTQHQSFITSALHLRYNAARSISRSAAGILFHRLGRVNENCILWFRQEVERTITWAGDPNDAQEMAKLLTPRKSFDLWKQTVKFTSKRWRVSEINVASRFAMALQNYYQLTLLRKEDIMLRMLNEKLEKANEELSNINWITSHDLKEPIRKIKIYTSIIMDKEGQHVSDLIKEYVNRIQKSTNRMQNLVDDIFAFSLASFAEKRMENTDLNQVLEEAKEWVLEEIEETGALITSDPLPVDATVIPTQMRQLFTNLLSNALKYAEKSRRPTITIKYERVIGGHITESTSESIRDLHAISIHDNGIGFDMEYNRKIFDIFYRLHGMEEYRGTGVGLAICKKIMENHGGSITAKGESGKGAVFSIYLPVL